MCELGEQGGQPQKATFCNSESSLLRTNLVCLLDCGFERGVFGGLISQRSGSTVVTSGPLFFFKLKEWSKNVGFARIAEFQTLEEDWRFI